ncbi:ThiF family adenylyltransferase [Tenacibaculum maritimum]|uniref:ThiF family adenylyltransferase n=1 Tax=Tenacibaculum maritimum TaxID=107401 RepID=UPI0038760B12
MEESFIEKIKYYIEEIPFVEVLTPFENNDLYAKSKVSIYFLGLDNKLEFDIVIGSQYPFKSYDSESIKFIDKDLLEYNHVMRDGTICIHTSHNPNIKAKLNIDFLSLKNWIIKYYLKKGDDDHYEHIIVPDKDINNKYFSFLFTEVDYKFRKNEFGFVKLSQISDGRINSRKVHNYFVQVFANQFRKEIAFCKWSKTYMGQESETTGVFIFIDEHPAIHNRFIFDNWNQFSSIFNQNFLDFLHQYESQHLNRTTRGKLVPFFIGYRISKDEIHWQVAMIKIGSFPIEGVKENGKWHSTLLSDTINWSKTRNSSYEYFFGRGTFTKELTDKKILIIGVGAIGSNVAKTLVRGGSKQIDLVDYDVKEPENICRAEYSFYTGITEKVDELRTDLTVISPFVEVGEVNQQYLEHTSKVLFKDETVKKVLESFLNGYDIIFDCSTDNDLMYVLGSLNLKNDLINLSITNHAKDLVCSFSPNVYKFVTTQFDEILDNDTSDLYNPTGCWSPTFKASYNDISLLVQYALKQLNLIYKNKLSKNSFVLETSMNNGLEIKLNEY